MIRIEPLNKLPLLRLFSMFVLIIACAGTKRDQSSVPLERERDIVQQDTLWKAPPNMPRPALHGYAAGVEFAVPAPSHKAARDQLIRCVSNVGIVVDTLFVSPDAFFCRTAFKKLDSLSNISPKLWVITSFLLSIKSFDSDYFVSVRHRTFWAVPPVDTTWNDEIGLPLHQALMQYLTDFRNSCLKLPGQPNQDADMMRRD